ncbi:MAG: zinc-ribbon domain-containing protein [Candidatus Heimdallarchaeaceae archaeon]
MSRRYSRYLHRRMLYGAPSLIIFGIIYLFYEPEIGGAMLAAGVLFSIILVINIVNRRRRGTRQTSTIINTGHQPSTYQPPIHYQKIDSEQPATQAESSKFCSHCGGKNDMETKFCTNCGANI